MFEPDQSKSTRPFLKGVLTGVVVGAGGLFLGSNILCRKKCQPKRHHEGKGHGHHDGDCCPEDD